MNGLVLILDLQCLIEFESYVVLLKQDEYMSIELSVTQL